MGIVRPHPHHCSHTTSLLRMDPESCNNFSKIHPIFVLKFDMDACLYNVLGDPDKTSIDFMEWELVLGLVKDSAVILAADTNCAEQILSTSLSAVPAKKGQD